MAEQPQQPAAASAARRPAGSGRWSAADLQLRMAAQHISPAVLRAAMLDAKKADFGSPDEAKACVDAYLKKKIQRTYP